MKPTPNAKNIKTFVRRERKLSCQKLARFEKLWKKYGLNLDGNFLDVTQTFKKNASLILEIGFGHGEFLVEAAITNPDKNYLGIEVYRPGIAVLLEKLAALNIENVRIFETDAKIILEKYLKNTSLEQILIYFPDPWSKRRHHKRRLIKKPFIDLMKMKLKKNGYFHFITDCENYAEEVLKIMSNNEDFTPYRTTSGTDLKGIPTRFARKSIQAKRNIYDFIFLKK